MLGYKVFGAGIPGLAVQALCQDALTGISAAGTTQGTATALTNAVNFISTVTANTGVILPANSTAGDSVFIYNGGANSLKVYPTSGASINQLSANASVTLATNTGLILFCGSTTQWGAVLSA